MFFNRKQGEQKATMYQPQSLDNWVQSSRGRDTLFPHLPERASTYAGCWSVMI